MNRRCGSGAMAMLSRLGLTVPLFQALCFFGPACQIETAQSPVLHKSSVQRLNSENFDQVLKMSPLLLVNFMAPWCGHSRMLEPELEKAAVALQGRVSVARVDASLEVELSERYNIGAYPTLQLLRPNLQPEEFTGTRQNASIVQWVEANLDPPLLEAQTEDEIQKLLNERQTLSYFVARGNDTLKETFRIIAEDNLHLGVFIHVPANGTSLVQVHRGSRGAYEILNSSEVTEPGQILQFLEREALPLFGQINDETFSTYLALAEAGLLWACLDPANFDEDVAKYSAVFREVAASFPQLRVAYVDAGQYQEHVEQVLGCEEFPTVVLQRGNLSNTEVHPKQYRQAFAAGGPLPLTTEGLTAWVRRALAGEVEEDDEFDEEAAIDQGSAGHEEIL